MNKQLNQKVDSMFDPRSKNRHSPSCNTFYKARGRKCFLRAKKERWDGDSVSIGSFGWPGTHSVDQADLELTKISLSLLLE